VRRVKRFLFLLVLLAGGVAWAAFAVPSNAAVVNGVTITQPQLNADVSAIANSHGGVYGCFLNAEEVVATDGESGLPPINGVAPDSSGGTHRVATTAFTAAYLDTVIGHQVVFGLAAKRHLVVTKQDLTTAHTQLVSQITAIMQDVSGSQYACAASAAAPLTGNQVLASMPSSFIEQEVRFDATVSVLEETEAGVGSSTAGLEKYFAAHRSLFDTTCFTVAGYSSAADAQAAAAKVTATTPFSQIASQVSGGGPQGCDILYGITQQLPTGSNLQSLPLNTVSAPISYNGSYLLVEITARTPTPFATAKSEVQGAVQSAGSATAQKVIEAAEGKASVSVDPRYGTWTPKTAQTIPPVAPPVDEVLNSAANAPGTAAPSAATTTPSGTTPATGQAG
jgi:hypothetical protein